MGQSKCRLEREAGWILEPGIIIFEEDCFRATNEIASRQSDRTGAAVQVDMDLNISHLVTVRTSA